MNDFNRGALQIPCLRLDYGFGEQWASVELGDGTGYVRLSDYEKMVAENAELRAERDEWHRVAVSKQDIIDHMRDARAENAKLRKLVRDMWRFTGAACKKYPRLFDPAAAGGQTVQLNALDTIEQRMRELGVEVE